MSAEPDSSAPPFTKPRIVVSQCLGFAAVRYNAQIIRDDFVQNLARHVEAIEVCPEVGIGLGVPRDPIRLVRREAGGPGLYQPATGRDITEDMVRFAGDFLGGLSDIDGFILKNRSPSCGIGDTKIYADREATMPADKGAGLFGGAVLDRFPYAAVEDEGRLRNDRIREAFLTRLYALARLRAVRDRDDMRDLVAFHTQYKYVLMTCDQRGMRELGRIAGNHQKRPAADVIEDYRARFARAIAHPARFGAHVNTIMHGLGYVSDELTAGEKAYFLDLLAQFRDDRLPISAVTGVLRAWIVRFGVTYLRDQAYFDPYPRALLDLGDSGSSRMHRLA